MIRIGCSGWSYTHWQGRFYPSTLPASGWLERYAERFDTVEVNATFYRLPPRRTVARWAEATPDNFCFAIKGSRYLTHVRRLRDVPDAVARLMERLAPLSAAGKLGPLLWQLPPTFRRDDDRLAAALAAFPQGRQAIEFRDPSWFAEDVYALLRERGVALVVADRAGLPEAPWEDTAGWWYLRFHHGRSGRRGNYSKAELRRWAARLAAVTDDVYGYFNNDWEGFAIENATSLRRLLQETQAAASPTSRAGPSDSPAVPGSSEDGREQQR
jgi:uncharacterized protein YecE (DUF72 family)